MEILQLKEINFLYGNNKVVSDFSLSVEKGEFVTLLGESGCGKTTLLRLIAGFLEPSSGEIVLNGQVINKVLCEKRQIGFVFQDYALFPHLTVYENLAYGLKNGSGYSKNSENISEDVYNIAQLLKISDLLDRFPYQLSGGQQQRVALGRSLVLKPQLILMDEPLSSLDASLRKKLRAELKAIQKETGITTIYVTHDQEEAFSLSDKIAVIKDGSLKQYGTPEEIYFNPVNKFVAEFTGQANYVAADGKTFLVRPEWIRICQNGSEQGTVIEKDFYGDTVNICLETGNGRRLICSCNTIDSKNLNPGNRVCFEYLYKTDIE